MQDDINEIKQDVKEVKNTLVQHAIHLEKYNTLLDIHIKRTQIAEYNIEKIEKELKPIVTHVAVVKVAGSILLALTIAYLSSLFIK